MKTTFTILLLIALVMPSTVNADALLASRTIRSRTILTAADVVVEENDLPGALSRISDVVGLETRVVLYVGRRISLNDVGPAAIIERNQIITLIYARGSLLMAAEGRSLGRAGVGEKLRVMNLDSRNTLSGIVAENGNVVVGNRKNFNSD